MSKHITKELVVAGLISETTRLNLQLLLEQAKKIRYDRDGLSDNYDLLLTLRGIWEHLKKRKTEEDKVEKEIIATRKAGYDEVMNPIAELLNEADPHISALNMEILLEERQVGLSIKKQMDTRADLAKFINETIRSIVSAPDNKELVRIQKLIGSEKSRKTKYGDCEGIAEESFDSLLKLIDGRKLIISETAKLQLRIDKAKEIGDDPAVVHLTELMETGKQELEENADGISKQAFEKISLLPVVGSEIISKAIKPRTHRWSWRVDDIELLNKKNPELVLLEPNKKNINQFLKSKTDELDDYDEKNFNGLVLFRKAFYVATKTDDDAA